MHVNKKLTLWAIVFALALPLLLAVHAGATVPVAGTYNTDAAVQDPTSGQWDLPATTNFFCIAPPASYAPTGTPDGTTTPPVATERDDLAAPAATAVKPAGCAATSAQSNWIAVNLSMSGTMGYCSGDSKYEKQSKCLSGTWTAIATNYATLADAINACSTQGYSWSGYSGTCGAAAWSTVDPDGGPAVASTGTGTVAYYTDHKGCLRCHGQPATVHNDNWAVKANYLKSGHKNMVRKVTAGKPWGLPGTDASGIYTNINIDWATGMTGTYTAYWIYGGNGLEGVAPSVISSKGGSYSCGRCHATGWSSDATINNDKEPRASFPSIALGTNTAAGQINLKGGIAGDSNTYSSWDRFGIQCSRCHVATGDPNSAEPGVYTGGHATFPEAASTGGDKTALCMNCHRQETTGVPDVVLGYKMPADSPAATLVIGGSHGAPPVGFVSHSHGTQFLNSPHARMSGTWNQIGCPPVSISPAGTAGCDDTMGTYNSDFAKYSAVWSSGATGTRMIVSSATTTGGGCTVCHDVHGTVLENVAGQSNGATTECQVCHVDTADTIAPKVVLANLSHPTTTNTPFDQYMALSPCEACHMPKGQHVFRISTNPTYTEFPPSALAADTLAATAPDADGFPAVWVDLDQACGQCHETGGALTSVMTGTPAPIFTTAQLAAAAEGIHTSGTSTTNGNAVVTQCLTCHSSAQGSYAAIVPGTNHHSGAHSGGCVACHADHHDNPANIAVRNGVAYVSGSSGNDFCLACHGNTGSHAHHHVTPALKAANLVCTDCHAPFGGVMPAGIPDSNTAPSSACLGCHSGNSFAKYNGKTATTSAPTIMIVPGTFANMTGKNHHGMVPGETDCVSCHQEGGVYLNIQAKHGGYAYTDSNMCLGCHQNYPYTNALLPGVSHHSGLCVSCHDPYNPLTAGKVTGPGVIPVQVTCSGCHVSPTLINHSNQFSAGTAGCKQCHAASAVVSGASQTTFAGVKPTSTTAVDVACGQCHGGGTSSSSPDVASFTTGSWRSTADLQAGALAMHTITPVMANFSYTRSTTSTAVVFDGSRSTCPSGHTCSYDWTFVDGTASGVTTTHTFVSTGTSTVTLKVTDTINQASATRSLSFTAYNLHTAPVVVTNATFTSVATDPTFSYIAPDAANPWQVSITDASTISTATGTIIISWGDGTVTKQATTDPNRSFSHQYKRSSTYRIMHSVVDSGKDVYPTRPMTATKTYKAIVPTKYTISGIVTNSAGAGLGYARVTLKLNGHTVANRVTNPDGSYIITNVLPTKSTDTGYTVTGYKYSGTILSNGSHLYSFPTTTITTLNSNQTVNIQSSNQ